jgi:hypothetical protein
LIQAITLFNQLDERDKGTFTEYVRAQTATLRKASVVKPAAAQPDYSTTICSKEGCEFTAVNAIHDPKAGYGGYHAFVPPTGKKRTRKTADAASGEPGDGSALAASGGGD